MPENLFKESDMSWIGKDYQLEKPDTLPVSLAVRRRTIKRTLISATRKENLKEFLKSVPERGETIHLVSNGNFDYWNFVPAILDLTGEKATEFYGSTWTMSRPNALQLLDLFDAGRLEKVTLLSGLYFKRRESSVYTTIAGGLIDRKQRFLCLENHAKVILMQIGRRHIVIEGSANFTANPRIEQNAITDDEPLYRFHQGWIDSLFKK